MAERMAEIMSGSEKLQSMALADIEKSRDYSLDKIYEQWMRVIQIYNGRK